jgi:hypothetical protein
MAHQGFKPAHMPVPTQDILSSLENILVSALEPAGYSMRSEFGMRHGSWVISFQANNSTRRLISAGLTPLKGQPEVFDAEFWVSLEGPDGPIRRTVDEFRVERQLDKEKVRLAAQHSLDALRKTAHEAAESA